VHAQLHFVETHNTYAGGYRAPPPAAESMTNETFVELMQQAVPHMGGSSHPNYHLYATPDHPHVKTHGISSRLVAAVLAIGAQLTYMNLFPMRKWLDWGGHNLKRSA